MQVKWPTFPTITIPPPLAGEIGRSGLMSARSGGGHSAGVAQFDRPSPGFPAALAIRPLPRGERSSAVGQSPDLDLFDLIDM
jgi:hypothetical protein